MLARLRDNWVYGGFLAGLMLLALTPVLARDWPLPLLLIWLQLPVYMLHQYEEHDDDRFCRSVNATIGGGKEVLSHMDAFVINLGGVWAVNTIAFILAASVHLGLGLTAVYLSIVNGIAHCIQGVSLRSYNPGLITSVTLFLPLGAATLWVFSQTDGITLGDHAVGLGVALLLHASIMARVFSRKRALNSSNGSTTA